MKVNFRKTVEFTPTWNGNADLPANEQLRFVLTPLDVGEALHIAALLSEAGHKGATNDAAALEETKSRMSIDQTKGLVEACGAYVKPHVERMDNAENFEVEDVVKYMYFLPLAADDLLELVRISQPTETDVKNSKSQPA